MHRVDHFEDGYCVDGRVDVDGGIDVDGGQGDGVDVDGGQGVDDDTAFVNA